MCSLYCYHLILWNVEKEYFNNSFFIDDKISTYHLFGVNFNQNKKKIDKVVYVEISKNETKDQNQIKNLLKEVENYFPIQKIKLY